MGSAAGLRANDDLVLEGNLLAREASRVRRRHLRDSLLILSCQAILVAVILGGWGWMSGRVLDRFLVSDPTSVSVALWRALASGRLWFHLRYTMSEAVVGYVWGAFMGLASAFVVILLPDGTVILRPFILLLFAMPKIVLAPLIIVWFGIGVLPKMILAGLFVFFIVFFNTIAGFTVADRNLLALARVMGAPQAIAFWKIAIPGAMPAILGALRTSTSYALMGTIAGEFMGSSRGIGYFINAAASQFRTADMYVGILGLLAVALLLNLAVTMVERRTIRWARRLDDLVM